MSTDMKRFTVAVPLDMEPELDSIKKNFFYNVPRSKMIRHILALGIKSFKLEKLEEDRIKGGDIKEGA
ncbi:MAG: hypothetical protein LBS24_07390 [Clostridiales Family XIII bacterium]|jgi:metal-responsive CopG/Arc/MetJ family transcriptional regulator|nr:hypothetical protein [Clostridiales Family XIII bacterium]